MKTINAAKKMEELNSVQNEIAQESKKQSQTREAAQTATAKRLLAKMSCQVC